MPGPEHNQASGDNTGYPVSTEHLYNIYTTSAQRLRRWSNIV